jgi:hypothetical protein
MSMLPKWLPSVETIRDNVVLARVTRHSRWPSLRTTVWLFVAAFLVGTGGTVALLVVSPTLNAAELLGYVFILGGQAVSFLSPPVAAVMAVIATVTDVRSEAYQLMRLSLLPREEIVSGYIYAALYRLRLLWVLAFGLLLPLVATLLTVSLLPEASLFGILEVLFVLAAWSTGAALGGVFNWLAVCIAVWQALRWKHVGLAIAVVIVLLGWTEVLGWVALLLVNSLVFGGAVQTGSEVSLICCYPVFFFLVSIVVYGLTRVIRERAESFI